MCGAGEWELQTTVEYAKVRKQFDHAIGFFQGVKFPLVNVMVPLIVLFPLTLLRLMLPRFDRARVMTFLEMVIPPPGAPAPSSSSMPLPVPPLLSCR